LLEESLKLINNYSDSFDVIYFGKGIIMSTTDFMSRISAAITLNQEAKKILGGISCNPSIPGNCELEAMNDALLGIPLVGGEFANEIGNGVKETLREEWNSLWDTVTNPIETVKETWAGLGEAVTNPRDTAVEAWESFKEPYVDDWTNGREGEAIGRGLTELGLVVIPGVGGAKAVAKTAELLRGLGRRSDMPDIPEIRPGSTEDLLRNAELREEPNKKRNRVQYDKPGGLNQANEDFDQYTQGQIVRAVENSPGTRTAVLEDGTKVTVRPGSSHGSDDPTLEIRQQGEPPVKVRYGADENLSPEEN
jgi:hypothetical protein